MHGQNKLRPAERREDGFLQVHEVWYTIQGEGPFAGCPAVFVRLTGCHLACTFCDTIWDDDRDPYISVEKLMTRIMDVGQQTKYRTPCKLVVFTGGEPLRQELTEIYHALRLQGYRVQVETAGTYWQSWLENTSGVTVVCSPKTKSIHPKIKEHCKHWKYVIQAGRVGEDGLPCDTVQFASLSVLTDRYGPPAKPNEGTVWLSPCDEGDAHRTMENIKLVGFLCLKHGYRAQVQMHKLMDLP